MEIRTLAVPLYYGPRGGAGSLADWDGTCDRTGTEGVGRVHGLLSLDYRGGRPSPVSCYLLACHSQATVSRPC